MLPGEAALLWTADCRRIHSTASSMNLDGCTKEWAGAGRPELIITQENTIQGTPPGENKILLKILHQKVALFCKKTDWEEMIWKVKHWLALCGDKQRNYDALISGSITTAGLYIFAIHLYFWLRKWGKTPSPFIISYLISIFKRVLNAPPRKVG